MIHEKSMHADFHGLEFEDADFERNGLAARHKIKFIHIHWIFESLDRVVGGNSFVDECRFDTNGFCFFHGIIIRQEKRI